MTQEEMDFSGLVGEFKVGERPLREFGYAVFELKPFGTGVYTLKLQLVIEISETTFTFPASELHKSVLTRQLPEGLLLDLAKHFNSPMFQMIQSRTAL